MGNLEGILKYDLGGAVSANEHHPESHEVQHEDVSIISNPQAVGDTESTPYAADNAIAEDNEITADWCNTCVDGSDLLVADIPPDVPSVYGLFNVGNFFAIVGQSKARKSFLALQLAVCIALGKPFLGFQTVRQRVYIANLELSQWQYKRRLGNMCKALGIEPDEDGKYPELEGWLVIDNLRGVDNVDFVRCSRVAHYYQCQVMFIDPFYKVFEGNESDPVVIQGVLRQLNFCKQRGISTVIVFHSAKGYAGDRQTIDMISGSGLSVRDADGIMALLNHAQDKDGRVLRFSLRNYVEPEDMALRFDNGAFIKDSGLSVEVATSKGTHKTPAQRSRELDIKDEIRSALEKHGRQNSKIALLVLVRDEVYKTKGVKPGETSVRNAIQAMCDNKELVESNCNGKAFKNNAKQIGLPEQMNVPHLSDYADEADLVPFKVDGGVK